MPEIFYKPCFQLVYVLAFIVCAPRAFCQSPGNDSTRGNSRFETVEKPVHSIGRAFTQSLMLGRGGSTTDAMFDGNKPSGVPTSSYEHKPFPVAISLTYRRQVGKHIDLGAACVIEQDGGRLSFVGWHDSKNPYFTPVGEYKRRVFTLAPEFTYVYTRRQFSATYSTLAVGISYQNDVNIFSDEYFYGNYANGKNWLGYDIQQVHNRFHANFQVTAIGWRYERRLGCFAELGMGYKGLLCLGASYNFGTAKTED